MKGFPRKSYYGKHVETNKAPAKPNKARLERRKKAKELLTGRKPVAKPAANPIAKPARKTIDTFETEYLKFIAQLKAKKEAEEKNVEVVEPTPAPVVKLEPVEEETADVDATPVELVETKPKKTTRKKKVVVEEPVEEFFVSEQPTIDGLD